MLIFLLLALAVPSLGQEPKPLNATAALAHAFDSHNVVLLGETHGCKQQYQWLREVVNTTEFRERVDDIVVELGNSSYQEIVDRYVRGEEVPFQQVQLAWRDAIGAAGPLSPVYENFFKVVRESNLKHRGEHGIRMVLGGPPGDWGTINFQELAALLEGRESWYAREVKENVLDKRRRALLTMGAAHFRRNGRTPGLSFIERQLREAGATTYTMLFDESVYSDPQRRFERWTAPAIVPIQGNQLSHVFGDMADALLYFGPRESLTKLLPPRAELDGTSYGREMERRQILKGAGPLKLSDDLEEPLFGRQ